MGERGDRFESRKQEEEVMDRDVQGKEGVDPQVAVNARILGLLRERVKELDCLYALASLAAREGVTVNEVMQGAVDLIPASWQYPDVTCARIDLGERVFTTEKCGCGQPVAEQSSDIVVADTAVGRLTVRYIEERPPLDEGPFSKEERALLSAIAQLLGSFLQRYRAQEEVGRLARFPAENPNPVIRVSADGSILYHNDAAIPLLEAWGCAGGEPLPAEWLRFVSSALRDGKAESTEVRCVEKTFSLTFAPIVEESFVNVYGLDVTERNRAEEELLLAKKGLETLVDERTTELADTVEDLRREVEGHESADEARRAAEQELTDQRQISVRTDRLRSLGEMAAGIAHELNQPLVGVRGSAEHVLLCKERGWDLSDEELRDKLTEVVKQADRMSHIIEHVRMFARESGKPERRLVQVNNIVTSAVEMLGAQFSAHGLLLDCELGTDLPPVSANPFSLEEVVLNLLTNCRHAVEQREATGSEGAGRVVIRTLSHTDEPRGGVTIQVVDNGVGIPGDVIERAFEPFFTTKRPEHGTGLGLSISKSIVEEFGGTIALKSEEGVGTTATVVLPAEG